MTGSINTQSKNNNSNNQCYCFNPNCQHPENPEDALNCLNCQSPLLLKQRYRAIGILGRGGFGKTFKAIDETAESTTYYAVKQFLPQQGNNPEKAEELFRQEAQRLETLGSHPRIPSLKEYFIEDNHQYLIQEFIQGNTLAQELEETGRFKEEEIKHLLTDILTILELVHKEKVIHRDIKPENIIRRASDGRLVLVDFGAAKHLSETNLGKTGTIIGSAAYTAPEQVKGKASYGSDLYSLGVTAIHLLTDIKPFDLYDSTEDIWVWRHFLSSHQKISQSLGKIIDKMLLTATKRRYQSATEVLKDLNKSPKLIPTPAKWLVASTILVFGLIGVRHLLYPITQQVSNRNSKIVTVSPNNNNSNTSTNLQPQSLSPDNGLFTNIDGKKQAFTLQNTEVNARVTGNISRVEVTQTFTNPYDKPLEAIYKFPLPDEAAVDDMEIRIGNRIIRGSIKKREEAKQIYENAKQEGKTAALLDQEKPNIFTQSLANILPGEKIHVTIRYTNSLKFEGGEYEFVFPMVVAPRYLGSKQINLAGYTTADTNINPPILPANRSGQDINVSLEIDAGVPISNIESLTHDVNIQKTSSTVKVNLSNQDTIPNRDLILRYQVAGKDTQTTTLVQSDERGGHFATYLIPAIEYDKNEIVPKDVVFLIDTSGSQSGSPIEQSKELMGQFITGLNPEDTFTIIDFANAATKLSEKPLTNTPENRQKALNYVNNLQAKGGTRLINGINTVLDFPPATTGRLRSVVLLTDGLIGQDSYVISEVQKRLQKGNRLYTFGVGSSTNRFLINRLAEVGRGTAEILPPNESAEKIAKEFFQEINNPVLTNVETTWIGEGDAPEIYPLAAPDLFAAQPLVLYGRKPDSNNGQLKITGVLAGGKPYEKVINVNFQQVSGNSAIAQLWGRAKIKDLMTQMHWGETPEKVEAVTQTALDYRLLSKYTSFVAVTEEVRVNPNEGTIKENIAVESPQNLASKPLPVPQSPSNNSHDVPEPGQIIGNIVALILLIFFFIRRNAKKNLLPQENENKN